LLKRMEGLGTNAHNTIVDSRQLPWTAVIVDCFSIADIIMYIIEVTRKNDPNGGSYIVRKRYNDFADLHKLLLKRFKSYQLPQLPPKCYKLSGADQEFLNARQEALQRYLDILSSSKDLCEATEVRTFVARTRPSQSRDVVTIPQIPEIPSELPDEAVKLLEDPRRAIRSLFLFQQCLEIDQFLANRLTIIDARRRHFIAAKRAVSFGMLNIDNYIKHLKDPNGVNLTTYMFMSEVIQVLRVCAQWADTTENEEGPLIRELLPSAKKVKPISWYQSEVSRLFHDSPPEDWDKKIPTAAQTLLDAIKQERRVRSTVRQSVAVDILKELEKAITRRNSEIVSNLFDKGGALDPTRDSAPGLDKNIIESSLPPPEITIATFQNRARTAISRMDTILVELSATSQPDKLQRYLSSFEVDCSMLLSFIQKLKKSPEVTGVHPEDPALNSASKPSNQTDDLLFKHPAISSDEESDDDDIAKLHAGTVSSGPATAAAATAGVSSSSGNTTSGAAATAAAATADNSSSSAAAPANPSFDPTTSPISTGVKTTMNLDDKHDHDADDEGATADSEEEDDDDEDYD